MDPLTALLYITGALGVLTVAALAYLASGRRPESRFALIVSLLLLTALFAVLPLVSVYDHTSQAPLHDRIGDSQADQK